MILIVYDKDSANRARKAYLNCRDAAYLMQRYNMKVKTTADYPEKGSPFIHE